MTDASSPLGDLGPLRQALAEIQGTNSDIMVAIAPAQQPTVVVKGLFGKPKQRPAEYGVQVVHFADVDGSGVFSLAVQRPAGPPLAQLGVLPAGAIVSLDDGESAALELPATESPASASAVVANLVAVAIAPWAPGPWTVAIDDIGASGD